MRDFLPDDVRRRQYVIGVVADVYQRYGYEPLETPSVENIETLLGKYGEEGDRLIFRILKRGDEAKTGEADLALRYDLTVPLARVIAEYRAQLPKFFKRYQIQPVWRADRPQKGRFREFYQCDVDAIGSTSPVIDAELCAAVSDVLGKLGFTEFDIVINHRGLLAALILETGVPHHLRGDALVALDKLDKVGGAGVGEELLAKGMPERPRTGCSNGSTQPGGPTAFSGSRNACPTTTPRDARRSRTLPRSFGCPARRVPDRTCSSSHRWRAGCRTTRARSSRSK
jgi:histidyl-tRNA synthetase